MPINTLYADYERRERHEVHLFDIETGLLLSVLFAGRDTIRRMVTNLVRKVIFTFINLSYDLFLLKFIKF